MGVSKRGKQLLIHGAPKFIARHDHCVTHRPVRTPFPSEPSPLPSPLSPLVWSTRAFLIIYLKVIL